MNHEAGRKKSALIVAAFGSSLTAFMGSSIAVALPSIAREFRMSAVLIPWVSTGYLLAAAMLLVPFGRVADIYGRKKVFQGGISLYLVSSLLAIISQSGLFFIFVRVIQGIGGSMIFGTGVAILTSVFPPGERGKVLGINGASVDVGLSLGPFIGGFLTEHLGWRSIFLSIVPLGLAVLYLTHWKLKGEWAEARGETIDLPGSLCYGFSLLAFVYGFSVLTTPWGTGLIGLGFCGMVAFIKWEMKVANPVLNIRLLSTNRVFAFSSLATLLHCSATFAVGFLLSLYLQYTKGLRPGDAGLVLISQPIVVAAVAPFAGKLSDRMDPKIVASAGMSVTMIGLLLLMPINETTSLPHVIVCLLLLGLGIALFASPNTNAVMASVDRKVYGVASSFLGTMRVTGNMFSMGIVTLVFSVYIGRVEITPNAYPLFSKSLTWGFLVFAVLCFGGIFASLARGKGSSVMRH